MRKIIYLILASILPLGIYAQDVPSDNKNSEKIDSLTQVINELSTKIEKTQEDKHYTSIWKKRRRFISFGYMNQTLTRRDIPGLKWKSDYGFSLAVGRTYYLHKKPILNMIKFGLDATWIDISYAKYSNPEGWEDFTSEPAESEGEEEFDLGAHQIDLGLHVGPSITINPVDHLKINAYFHFIPTGSVAILNDEANACYVSNFAIGGAISYKVISLGIESRWGKAKYNSFGMEEDIENIEMGDNAEMGDFLISEKNRLKTKSLRFFLILRY